MRIEIVEESAAQLSEYGQVSIAFDIRSVFDVEPTDAEGRDFQLQERSLVTPIEKDYDSSPGNHPSDWPAYFDVANWGFLAAWLRGERVGGAAVAFRTPLLEMLEDRNDMAVLWDIRVAPRARGQGIGSALIAATERWISERGGRWLKAETQSINVLACRFYERHGFTLKEANRLAYAEFPDEIQLLWYKELRKTH